MALVVKDRVRESSATSGTGTITLSGAYVGFQTFSSAIADSSTVFYCIHNTAPGVETEWEVGYGTYSANTLTRDTIYSSSTGSTIDFSAGTKEVFVTYPSESAVYEDNDGNVTVEGKITVGAAPTADLDVATKLYVDNLVASGIHFHAPVRLEHVGNLPGTYDNGTAGVGATLTNNSTQVALTADGVAVGNGDRVLFYEQTDATENGVYVVTDKGSASTNWVLTRATDADSFGLTSPNTLGEGSTFFVREGNTASGETYTCNTAGTITFGTTDITFAQVSAAAVYSGVTPIDVTGTVISLTTVPVTLGGTNISSYTLGEVLYASGTTTLAQLAGNTTTTAKYLTQTGTGSASAAPTWTALAASATTDTTNAANISSGTLPSARISGSYTGVTGVGTLTAGTWNASVVGAAYGGTGLSSYTVGDIVYATGTTTIGKLADIAVGNVLLSGGIGVQPEYGKVGLTTHVSGVLPVANGGTGQSTASGAINGLVPAQTGNSTKFLQTDGSVVSWQQPTTLYNSTNIKLATTATGIDVTGTVVADGLQVDGGTANGVTYLNGSKVLTSGSALTFDGTNLGVVGGTSNASDLATAYSLAAFNITPKSTSGYSLQFGSGPSDLPYIQMSAGGAASGNMTIQPYGGSVGIGTTAPSGKFEVSGGRSWFTANSEVYSLAVRYGAGTGTMYIGATNSATPSMQFSNGGGAALVNIDWNGSVGIGATSPAQILEVKELDQTGFTGIRVNNPTSNVGSAGIEFQVDATYSKAAIYQTRSAANGKGDLIFAVDSNSDAANWVASDEKVRITGAGNVGIGTSSPASKLHVSDSGAVNNNCFNVSTPANDKMLLGANLVLDAAGNYTKSATSISGAGILFQGINQLNAHGSIQFLSAPDNNTGSATPLERMRIDSSGNVGIGTSSLDSKLNVNGRVFAAGSLTSSSGDLNFGAGGSRAFMDWNGSQARIGTLTGGGSGGPIGFFVNNSELASLDTSGNFTATGNVTAYSDERLKKDWEEVKPTFVDQLANVKSGTYTRTDSDARQAGVSAQSLQELLPETVMAGKDGMLSVAYGNAAMVAVVELAKEVRKLKEELRALKGE